MKIRQLSRSLVIMLCAALLLECASAGFVWAENEGPESNAEAPIAEEVVEDEEEGTDSVPDAEASEPGPKTEAGDPSDEGEPEAPEDLKLQEDPVEGGDDTPDPEPLNGWVDTDAGRMYYVDNVAQTGMQKIDGKKYYFDESGIMQTGMVDISGKRYCFGKDGVMRTGMIKYSGAWYYFSSKGVMQTGWKTIEKKKYYFNTKTGKRSRGKKTIDGSVYYFGKGGVMTTGWLKLKGKKYYHDPKTGARIFGSKKIGKYYYYFRKKTGVMKKGWLKLKGKRYYYNSKGIKLFGAHKIGKKTYYLHMKTGARISKGSYYLYKPVWNKSSSTKYLIYVSKKSRYVTVYKGSIRNWTIVKRIRCSIGKPSTPTPSGTYHVTSKVLHFGESKGYSVWYATGFIGTSYLLHSVVCYRGTKSVSDGRLGKAISHGCIRMPLGSAKWMYNTVPHGSTVYIK